MAKRKMIQYNLLKNSISAYFAAIELHNKPNIAYRYETVTLLLINAWELMLKAFIRKFIKEKSIFKEDGHTISIDTAILFTEEYIALNVKKGAFRAIKENLLLMEEYRNRTTHFYNEAIEPVVFTLLARNALNYVEFIKKYFKKDVMAKEGLFILPLGFKLPFKPEDYLSRKAATYNYSEEIKNYIDKIVSVVENLKHEGIEDSVVLGFSLYLDSVKKITNSDLLVAITNKDEASLNINQTKKVHVTDDRSAVKVYLSEDDICTNFPLTHKEIVTRCKLRYRDCLINAAFHNLMKSVQANPNLALGRKLNVKKQGKPEIYYYSEKVLDLLDERYTKKV